MFPRQLSATKIKVDSWRLDSPHYLIPLAQDLDRNWAVYLDNESRWAYKVPAGFVTDFASVPNWVPRWFLDDDDYAEAAVHHDRMWRMNREGRGPDPVLTDRIYRRALNHQGANAAQAWGAWWAVRGTAILSGRRGSMSSAAALGVIALPVILIALPLLGTFALLS